MRLTEVHGNQWQEIAKVLGRTASSVRNKVQRIQRGANFKSARQLCKHCGRPRRGHVCLAVPPFHHKNNRFKWNKLTPSGESVKTVNSVTHFSQAPQHAPNTDARVSATESAGSCVLHLPAAPLSSTSPTLPLLSTPSTPSTPSTLSTLSTPYASSVSSMSSVSSVPPAQREQLEPPKQSKLHTAVVQPVTAAVPALPMLPDSPALTQLLPRSYPVRILAPATASFSNFPTSTSSMHGIVSPTEDPRARSIDIICLAELDMLLLRAFGHLLVD